MSAHEIPLLRESAAYATRLMDAARVFSQRRIRVEVTFHDNEQCLDLKPLIILPRELAMRGVGPVRAR